jgi:hypothetical protein
MNQNPFENHPIRVNHNVGEIHEKNLNQRSFENHERNVNHRRDEIQYICVNQPKIENQFLNVKYNNRNKVGVNNERNSYKIW